MELYHPCLYSHLSAHSQYNNKITHVYDEQLNHPEIRKRKYPQVAVQINIILVVRIVALFVPPYLMSDA